MFKYYTVETLAMSIDPNHDYTPQEIEYLYKDYKEIDQGVIEHGPAAILVIAEVYGWEAPREIGERDPAGFRGHPTDCDIECLGVIKPENTVKYIHKMLKLYRQHKAGK